MALLSYRRHRFPPPIIQHAIWLYLRFTLSYRDVEDLLAERGLDLSYETVRRWVPKFGRVIARRLRRRRPRPSNGWHLDETVVRIAGKRMYLWRAVDHEGEVLDMLVQRRRDSRAGLRLMRKLLKKQGFAPKLLVTDKLRSYASAFRRLGLSCLHEQGLRRRSGHWMPLPGSISIRSPSKSRGFACWWQHCARQMCIVWRRHRVLWCIWRPETACCTGTTFFARNWVGQKTGFAECNATIMSVVSQPSVSESPKKRTG